MTEEQLKRGKEVSDKLMFYKGKLEVLLKRQNIKAEIIREALKYTFYDSDMWVAVSGSVLDEIIRLIEKNIMEDIEKLEVEFEKL